MYYVVMVMLGSEVKGKGYATRAEAQREVDELNRLYKLNNFDCSAKIIEEV